MAYKKYHYRNGKKYGPYLYESYRDENGKVRKKYIGSKDKKGSGLRGEKILRGDEKVGGRSERVGGLDEGVGGVDERNRFSERDLNSGSDLKKEGKGFFGSLFGRSKKLFRGEKNE